MDRPGGSDRGRGTGRFRGQGQHGNPPRNPTHRSGGGNRARQGIRSNSNSGPQRQNINTANGNGARNLERPMESLMNAMVPESQGQDNNRRHDRQWDGPKFGFKKLHDFLTKTDNGDDVAMFLNRNISDWEKLLDSSELVKEHTDDFLVLIIHIIGEKLCSKDCNVPKIQATVLSKSVSDLFINKLKDKCMNICLGTKPTNPFNRNQRGPAVLEVDQSAFRILNNIHTFCSLIAQKMPKTASDSLKQLIAIAKVASGSVPDVLPNAKVKLQEDFDSLLETFKQLEEKCQAALVQTIRRSRYGITEREENEMHLEDAPDDFRNIPITPTVEELRSTEAPYLRTNRQSGAYLSANHYLDVQFRLLREDFVRPLKIGVQDYIKNRVDYMTKKKRMPLGNVRMYPGVHIFRAELVKDTYIFNVQLAENNKKVNWQKSKRLLNGSLLVFTTDMFTTAYFATVASRDIKELAKGKLGIKWEGDSQPIFNRDEEFLMVECEVYFEAFRHTLETLKSLDLEEFPMYKFIVESSANVRAPAYLEAKPEHALALKSIENNNILLQPLYDNQWPHEYRLGLDEKQYNAFKAALTKEFAIIQGPPGTGKTFLGLKITEVLLNNTDLWKVGGVGPILVVCYTNHALDQFMEGILRVFEKSDLEPAMIRVGGRCQSEVLDPYSLFQQRRKLGRILGNNYFQSKSDAWHEVRVLQNTRKELMTELMGLKDMKGIVDFEKLKVWETLSEKFPQPVWTALENWYFAPDGNLLNTYAEDQLLDLLFKLRNAGPNGNQFATQQSNGNNNDTSSDDDDEDYDLDEVMGNRITDDLYAEVDTAAGQNMGCHLNYLGFSIPKLENTRQTLIEKRSQIMEEEKNRNERAKKITKVNQDIALLIKKQIFVTKLFDKYTKGLVEVNNVTDLIVAARQNSFINLSTISVADKWAIYFTVVEKAMQVTENEISKTQRLLINAEQRVQEILKQGDGILLRSTQVVGMTTTAAAKYNDLLKIMRSRIVIVEEAAEVLEAHIVTCITKHCEHLILIGDHRQLRPSTNVYNLAKQYHLDLSLFERMINNNLNCYQLRMQHRMRPEIADLVVGTIYDRLENHESVNEYPSVAGISKNLFFINHKELEKAESDSTSKSNVYEAAFLAKLCRHLILQGYTADQITVLTTYVGQMFLLKKEISAFEYCKRVKVTCVDNYQGEENDVILLSLVRSNVQENIGFLKEDNRICVAISRAKHGLYICGNMSILSSKNDTWKQIQHKLEERDEIGEKIDFECQNHGTITSVGSIRDFDNVPEGGCTIPCDTTLKCLHKCPMLCHILDKDHSEYKCKEQCQKKCKNDHQCVSRCFEKCKRCPQMMQKTLPICGHVQTLACHIREEEVPCRENVEKTLSCGHKEIMACHKNPNDITCRVRVQKHLGCGHVKEAECHVQPDEITCKVVVRKLLPCGHEDDVQCHIHEDVVRCRTVVKFTFEKCGHEEDVNCFEKEKPRTCKSKCSTRLNCGHACIRTYCHANDDPDHVTYLCKKDCGRTCANGDHRCKPSHKCHTACKPCMVKVPKKLPCTHIGNMDCSSDVKDYKCLKKCERKLPCQHKCENLCHEDCGLCMVLVKKSSPECGHIQTVHCSDFASKSKCDELVLPKSPSACIHNNLVLVPCRVSETIAPQEAMQFCKFPCGVLFDEKDGGCGHRCKGTCSGCQQGRIHLKCRQSCKRPLVCGHLCDFWCSESCPPCTKPCTMKCEHSECRKICGEPCTDCNEKCTWGCMHRQCSKLCREPCDIEPCEEQCQKKIPKCGHPCVGFCGDPCPPLCRICDKDELTEVFIGFEDEEGAMFVYLEDCKHTIESQGMDMWMKSKAENEEIGAKECPRCKTLIKLTRRYGNAIRLQLQTIIKVKEKIFGDQKVVQRKLNGWALKIHVDVGGYWERYLPRVKNFLMDKLVTVVSTGIAQPKLVPKKVGESSMESFHLIAKHAEDVLKLLKNSQIEGMEDVCMEDMVKRYTTLFRKLIRRSIPLSKIEVRDFDLEFQRLFDLQQLYRFVSSPSFTSGNTRAQTIYERAGLKVLALEVYSNDIQKEVHQYVKELEEVLKTGLGISERERREILSAMNMQKGRWFECPNGHVYVITECGGAMEESTCNECGARIGGGSHRLRADNALATKMDGATQPLYPNMV